ncbi:MAG: Gfo/Idh/MocA family oxidoreductase [Phycisphaerales bacterium]
MSERKSYAVVGTGSRCRMFLDAIFGAYAPHARFVGMCDTSRVRMQYWADYLAGAYGFRDAPMFHAGEFDAMLERTRPDTVIVASMDCTHDDYIVRALEHGCDVVTEKPMTTDAEKARRILDAVERTGRDLCVTFNYRYRPDATVVREVIQSGAIGRPVSVNLQWYLDTSHGADYFRRWHREKDKSGGLIIHKASHHFDLVNFWIDDWPETVMAMGDLKFYGRENARQRGKTYDYDRYTGVPQAKSDPFALMLDGNGSDASLKGLYLDAEAETGYLRDRNVFGDNITIEDTMGVLARYRKGAVLNYSLLAYCPWEGERAIINGTEGQVELFSRGKGHIIRGQSDEELDKEQYVGESYVRLQRMFEPPRDIPVPEVKGGHGGADAGVLKQIFTPKDLYPSDPINRGASYWDGAAALLVGAAANLSMKSGKPVKIDDLLPLPAHA